MKTKIRATMLATVAAAALVAGLTGIAQARTPSAEPATAATPTSGDAVVGDEGARAGEQRVAGRHDRPGDRSDGDHGRNGRDRRGGNDRDGRHDGSDDGDHDGGDHDGGHHDDGDHRDGGHDDDHDGGGRDDDHGTRRG